MSKRWTGILAVALATLGSVGGCDDPARVVVSVGRLPADSNTVMAQFRVGGSQYEVSPRFAVDSAALGPEGRYSFGLRLHDRKSGQLSVHVAALRSTGEDATQRSCLLATETGQVTILDSGEATLSLDLNRQVFDGSGCNAGLPIIASASQQLIDARVRLAVDGFGFAPETALLFDGVAQPFVSNDSPLQLTSDLPVISAPSGARAVQVQAQRVDGSLSNPVSYIASEPWFDMPSAPVARGVAGGPGIPLYTAAASGDFNGDKLLDVAITGYYQNGTKRGSGFIDLYLGNGRGLNPNRRTSAVWNNSAMADPSNVIATAIAVSDYRKASKPDVIVAIHDTATGKGGFVVLNNDGRGYFSPTTTAVLDGNFASPSQMAHVDVNPTVDTGLHPDVVLLTTNSSGGSLLNVFLSDTNGNIGTNLFWNIGVGRQVSGWSQADINGDGAIDFAFIGENPNNPQQAQVHTILNYRNGKIFQSFSDTGNTCNILGFGGAVLAQDWYGTGRAAIAASSAELTSSPEASVQTIRSRELLTMHPPAAPANPPAEPGLYLDSAVYSAGAAAVSLAAVDGDRDASLDLAVALRGNAMQPTRIVVLHNSRPQSDSEPLFPGQSGAKDALPTLLLWGENGDVFLLADDFNRDTQPDLLAIVRGDANRNKPGAVWLFKSQ